MDFEAKYNTKSPAVKRLMKEAAELHEATEEYYAAPLDDNLFEWHFTVRGPPSTEFDGGVYHGRILLPPEYPMKPPNIILLTPNGRFKINKKICLSISGHHPETWQPSWSIRTALLALIAFMPTPGNLTIGALDDTPEERQVLAKKSLSWECESCGKIVELLSKTGTSKPPITQEEKHMISNIDLKPETPGTNTSQETTDRVTNNVMNQALRQRLLERQQIHILRNESINSSLSSSNDFFWSILIGCLVTAIILLVLRRIFLV